MRQPDRSWPTASLGGGEEAKIARAIIASLIVADLITLARDFPAVFV